jgi:hypothetical protein
MPRRQRGVTAAQQSTGDPTPVGAGHVERVRVPWGSGSSIRKRSPWKATRHKLSGSGVCEVCGWEPKRTYRVYAGPRTREALLEKIRLVEFEQELLRRGRSA